MKKAISIICIIGAVLIILDSANASHWLLLFFLAGVIPGTNIHISAIDTLAANATAITIVILRITAWSRIRTLFFAQDTTAIATKRRTPHRVV